MPLMLLESQALRVGIPKGEIKLAKKSPRPIPKGIRLPSAGKGTFMIMEAKE